MLLLLPFLLAPAAATGQTWSEPQQPANLSPVQIQWRMYGVDTRTQKNIFEWIFSNAADTAVEFNYRIETNRGETRIGRISIKPRRKQLSGWLFSGDSLVSIKVARSAFGGKE